MPLVYTVKTRKCLSCGDTGMVPEQRQFMGMETTMIYACPACSEKVELKSLAQAGLMTAVGLILLAVIAVVATTGSVSWDFTDYLLYAGVVLLFAYVPGATLVPYWGHPVTGEKQISDPNLDFDSSAYSENFSDIIQRAIIKFERHGFLRGFLTPIIFVGAVLAFATALGMINYYLL